MVHKIHNAKTVEVPQFVSIIREGHDAKTAGGAPFASMVR